MSSLSEKAKRSCSHIHTTKTKLIHIEKWEIWGDAKVKVNKMQELTMTSFEPLSLFGRHGL
jgi:hypothetical protein